MYPPPGKPLCCSKSSPRLLCSLCKKIRFLFCPASLPSWMAGSTGDSVGFVCIVFVNHPPEACPGPSAGHIPPEMKVISGYAFCILSCLHDGHPKRESRWARVWGRMGVCLFPPSCDSRRTVDLTFNRPPLCVLLLSSEGLTPHLGLCSVDLKGSPSHSLSWTHCAESLFKWMLCSRG